MRSIRRSRASWLVGPLVATAGLMVFNMVLGQFIPAAIDFVLGAAIGSAIVLITRKERHRGNRQAEGDHQDQGASASGVATNYLSIPVGTASWGSFAHNTSLGSRLAIGPSSATAQGLPVRESDETIRAFKLAYLILDGTRPRFCGIGQGSDHRYGVEEVAVCVRRTYLSYRFDYEEDHCASIPNPSHTCGFYAVPEPPEAGDHAVVLEVELYGTVIVHEHGYRAEKQRVLSVRVARQCASGLCDKDAICVAPIESKILPLCADHAALIEQSPLVAPAPLSAIASLLGTEVRWA